MDLKVGGKLVVMKDRLPAKENWGLIQRFEDFSRGDLSFEGTVYILTHVIESWEFDGDPAQPEAYEEMDLFGEVMPVMKAIGLALQERVLAIGEQSKN